MHPIALVLRVGDYERAFGTYGVCLALGIALVGLVVVRAADRSRIDRGVALAGLAIVVGLGFASAWSSFLLVELARTGSLAEALARGGGLVVLGALPGIAIAIAIATRILRFDALALLEQSLPGVACAHALGRVGCFLGGCCYGAPFDGRFAVVYTHAAAPAMSLGRVARHPVQLYEAAVLLTLALLFALWRPSRPGDGRHAAVYLAAYCAIRSILEFARGDRVRGLWLGGAASTAQLCAIAGVACAVWLAARGARSTEVAT